LAYRAKLTEAEALTPIQPALRVKSIPSEPWVTVLPTLSAFAKTFES
jgi:hypothetical protein